MPTKPRAGWRPGRCSCCSHPERARLEMMRLGGASQEAVAKAFGVSRFSVLRHMKSHVTPKRKSELLAGSGAIAELVEAAAKEDRSLLDYYIMVRGIAAKRLLACAEANDTGGVNLMIARLHENFSGIAKLTGQVGQLTIKLSQTNNLFNIETSPAFISLVEAVLDELRDEPEKRARIIQRVRGLSDAASSALGPNGSADTPAPVLEIEGEALANV
jgi:hypothetical protein